MRFKSNKQRKAVMAKLNNTKSSVSCKCITCKRPIQHVGRCLTCSKRYIEGKHKPKIYKVR